MSIQDKRIPIPTQDGFLLIKISKIIYCQAVSNYTSIICQDQQILSTKTLKHYEQLLSPYQFHRIHHAHLVNIQHICIFNRSTNTLTLSNTVKLNVSRSKKAGFLEHIWNMK